MQYVFYAYSSNTRTFAESRSTLLKMKFLPVLIALTCTITIANCFMGVEDKNAVLSRNRRTVLSRVFVVRRSSMGGLFSLASVPPIQSEVFQFVSPAPAGLLLNSSSGIVSRNSSVQLIAPTIIFLIQRNSSTSSGIFDE